MTESNRENVFRDGRIGSVGGGWGRIGGGGDADKAALSAQGNGPPLEGVEWIGLGLCEES